MRLTPLFIIATLLGIFSFASADLSCLDRNGKPVPWFNLIKYPGNVSASEPTYAYFDQNSGPSFQAIKGKYVDSKDEALPNTVMSINQLITSNGDTLNVLVYNDEPPNKPYNPKGGHAKGFIAYDNSTKSGIYIMHSFPKYPSVYSDNGQIEYTTPKNTYEYGQNAYCITLNEDALNKIHQNLPVEEPNVYHATGFFQDLANTSNSDYAVTQFNLVNGDNQWFLTKSPNYSGFLYDDIIAPYFKVNLAVESWGRPYQPASCTIGKEAMNIDEIRIDSGASWDHYSDHAKWAVTVGIGLKNLACSCDMNRMTTQAKRGGSCLCTQNTLQFNAFSTLIVQRDKCKVAEFLAIDA
jgi:deoxyribonuclease-2